MQIVLIFHRIVGKSYHQGIEADRTVVFLEWLVALEDKESLKSDPPLTEVLSMKPST